MLAIAKNFMNFKSFIINILKLFLKLLDFFIILITVFTYFLVKWLKENFCNLPFNDVLFNLFMPIKGTESKTVYMFILKCILPTITLSALIFIIKIKLIKLAKNKNNILNYKLFKKNQFFNITIANKNLTLNLYLFNKKLDIKIKRIFILISILLLEIFCIFKIFYNGYATLKIDEFLKENQQNSNFIKNNYIDPKKVKLIFPNKKRNLIYIFAESMESSYFSKKLGGNEKFNLMKPLTKLTLQNLNFSNNDKIGGACNSFGSTFTTAGIVSQTLGIPLKISPKIVNLKQNHAHFFNNACGLGDILHNAGYKQIFLIGSDKKFGNRNSLMENHGKYEIYDYFDAKNDGTIDKNYKVWWGIEDSKLFEIAKVKILELSKSPQPFNFTMLTTNTHCPEGFVEPNCKLKFEDTYSNAIYYSAKQINDFVEWIKKQHFFKNTTIVISGDHLSMAKKHFKTYTNKFNRTIFNLFINNLGYPKKTKNRVFNSLDMFPTTLASLGVKIKGNRLGLGTNLFSNLKTLSEIFTIDYVNQELKKHSNFYDINFIYKK